jgi:hypothetical protein
MTSTTRLPIIQWDRASRAQRDKFLNTLNAAANLLPRAKTTSLPTDNASGWLTGWTSLPYPPNVTVKVLVEALGKVSADPLQFADIAMRGTFFTDAAGVLAQSGPTIQSYVERTNGLMDLQFLVNADNSLSVQVRDSATGSMQYLLIVDILEVTS